MVADIDLKILAAIVKFAETGYPPTYRDVARATGMALSAVHGRVQALRQEGLIHAVPVISRSLSVTDSGRDLLEPSLR